MIIDAISDRLEAESTVATAKATQKQVHTLRGVRGTPTGNVARICADTWKNDRPSLPADEVALDELFGAAWEDGLVAVGLLAALVPDSPGPALEIARDWLERLDDAITADALGWMVLGPALLASRADLREFLTVFREHEHPATRRAAVSAGLAMTPTRLEGPSAAALRERLGVKNVQFVEKPLSSAVASLCHAFVRDEDAGVRKALRRVLGSWAASAPNDALQWVQDVRGGCPVMFREEIEQAAKKALRNAPETDSE